MKTKEKILQECGLDTAFLDEIRVADGNNKTILKRILQAMDIYKEDVVTIGSLVDDLRASTYISSASIVDKEVIISVHNNIHAIDFAKKFIATKAIMFFDIDTIIHSPKVQTFYCAIKHFN